MIISRDFAGLDARSREKKVKPKQPGENGHFQAGFFEAKSYVNYDPQKIQRNRKFQIKPAVSIEYFETAGALFVVYTVVRFGVWRSLRLPDVPPERRSSEPGKSIDATVLAERMRQVRQDHQARSAARPTIFNRPFLIEAKREEVAKRAFFQKPPAPEPSEEEHGGMSTFLV